MSLLHFVREHLIIHINVAVKAVALAFQQHHVIEFCLVDAVVVNRDLHIRAGVQTVQDSAVSEKDRFLLLLLCNAVVDVIEPVCLAEMAVVNAENAVINDHLIRQRLLNRFRDAAFFALFLLLRLPGIFFSQALFIPCLGCIFFSFHRIASCQSTKP